jgi:hypothetical protein
MGSLHVNERDQAFILCLLESLRIGNERALRAPSCHGAGRRHEGLGLKAPIFGDRPLQIAHKVPECKIASRCIGQLAPRKLWF